MLLVIVVITISSFPVSGQLEFQECVTDSRNPWEWPSNNHWFVGQYSGSLISGGASSGQLINFQGGSGFSKSVLTQPMAVYEGVTAISDDNGDLVLISNGKYAWDVAGNITSTDIKEGDEAGGVDPTNPGSKQVGSSSQGVMSVRHPLTPNDYYVISVGDIIGAYLPGMTYNIFNEKGVETQGNTPLGVLVTEGITATLHENGIDVWVVAQKAESADYYAFLLTCDGFDPPVISSVGRPVSGNDARGGLAFSHDGEKLASCFPGPGVTQATIYDFDKKTGQLSGKEDIAPFNKIVGAYDVIFSKDNSKLYITSGGFGLQEIDIATKTYNSNFVTGPSNSNHTIEIGRDGNYYLNGADGLWSWNGGGSASKVDDASGWGLPTLYVPPAEEPDIEEVGPFCDTTQIIDLHTNWVCCKLSAEDTLLQRHLYQGNGIVDDKLGHFNPAIAGPGLHEIIFTYCDVNDTIWIDVKFCPNCRVELEVEHPEICVGEELRLDTFINIANGDRFWTIDSFPTTAAQKAEITFTGDTVFDATNLGTHYGTYKLMLANVFEGDSCFDSIYVTVNPLPEPDLGNDSTICFDWDDVTFDAGPFVSFDWGTDGGDVQTITKSEAKLYKVEVTDLNGCKQKDSVELFINELPKADLGDSLEICEGDDAVIFDASTASIGGEGSAITKYTWEDGSDGATKTTDVDGTYWVAIEDANMCHDTDTVVLTVHALPEVELRSDTSICAGDAAIEFIAFAGLATDTTYTWDSGEIGEMISKDAAGIYKVVMEDQFGCLDSDEVELTINALPVIELRDSTICGDADPVLWDAAVATPGMTTYIWSDTDVAGDGKLETKIDGIYWIIIEDANQCSDTDTVVLTVNNFVPVEIGPDTSICEDADDVLFDAGIEGAQSYIWALEDFTPVGSAQTFTTGVDGKYYLALIDSNGCQGADSIILTVNLLPKVDLGPDTAICKEDPKVVFDAKNAGVGMTYSWSTNEASQTIENDVAGEYWVAIKDVKGCTDSDTIVLTVHDLPVVDLGDDVEICAIEDSVLFNAGHSTAQSWVWDHGRTTQTIKAKNEGTETYRVVVTDENGCIGEDEVDLTVSPMPEVTIRDSSVCIDADDVLFDVGADFDQYLWSNGDATRTSTISAAGDYSVTFTTLEGCEGTADFKLERTALPTPDLGADQIICADASALDFTPGVFASYLWNDGKTTPTLSTKVAGDYEVEVTDDKGCKASDDVKLTVIDMPTPDIIKDETKCPGSPHTFDVVGYDNGNGPYTYAWQDGSTASTFPTAIATTVWVDITDQYGCTGRDLGSVIDKSDLTVNILDNLTVNLCEGEDVTLIPNFKASDGYFFTWSADGSGTSETFLATATGTYDLHVDNGGGCKGDGTIDVILHLDPVLAPDTAGICDGEAALIGGMNNLGGTYTYLWNTGETSATISVLTAGIYTQEVTSNQKCVSEETVDVDVYSNPTPSIQGTTVCQGVPVTLTDLNDKGETTDFIWSTGATTATISPTTTGSFTLDVIDIHGCEGTSTTAVTFIAYPTVDLGKDMVICEGDDKVTFDAGNIGNTITWNSGQTTSTISTDQAGEYIVTVSDGGCPAYDTVVLSVVDLPVSELNQLLGVAPYCFNELETAILLEAGARNDYEYLWGTGETTPSITVDAPGTYLVEISAGSCFITDRITLMDYCPSTLYVPNTFTPDNDGLNDYFLAVGDYIANFEMYVYNRWGQLIFHSDNIYEGWDGTYSGNEVQIDTYVYKIYYDVNQPDLPPASLQKVGIVNVLK